MPPKVLLATPTFDGQVCIEYLHSALRLKEFVDFDLCLVPGVHFVDQARDLAVARFLASDAEFLFFVDADLGWPAEAFMAILEAGKPVCGGGYRVKNDQHLYPQYGVLEREGGFWRVGMLPGGFLCIRRDVLEHLWQAVPHYRVAAGAGFVEVAGIFTRELHDGVMVSEDAMFSRRAQPWGLWLYPDIDFRHVGRQSWQGNYLQHLAGGLYVVR